ncbi:MAG: hypothetical protein AAB650_01395, partial [Patescibacteria group bacterium]
EPKDQERFESSVPIGWKTPRRRPIAWLRAIELKPDVIISVDDDNIPPDDYFDTWYSVLTSSVTQTVLPVPGAREPVWHNYLRSSDAPIEFYPRGFPIPFRGPAKTVIAAAAKPIPQQEIGLFQGISLGDPDIDSLTRMVYPKRMPLKAISEKNYCLRDVWSPYNMQSTAYRPILFGLPILWPHNGRFDDIYASFAFQKLLFNNRKYAYVGDPINLQDRGVRNTLKLDFPEEIHGHLGSHEVWSRLNEIEETDSARFLEKLMAIDHEHIQRDLEFFKAFRQDISMVLK